MLGHQSIFFRYFHGHCGVWVRLNGIFNGRLSNSYLSSDFFIYLTYSIAIFWAVERHADYAFVLQDLLGISLLMVALETIRMPNFKVGTMLLSVFFCYDIFFVFITPYLTPHHDSVMVSAATGGDQSQETMPLALNLPRFIQTPCFSGDSLLGFGDIVIPGTCIAHMLNFDVELLTQLVHDQLPVPKNFFFRYGFFITALVSYSLGLLFTYIGLNLMATAQPALMYLSPCVLFGIWIRAWYTGKAQLLWRGLKSPEHGIGTEEALLSEEDTDFDEGVLSDVAGAGATNGYATINGVGGLSETEDGDEDDIVIFSRS